MADDFASLGSCSELTAEHAALAARTLPMLKRLFARVAEIARPEEGCPKILMVVARVSEASWLEGELLVELSGDAESTTISLYADHGFGIRERVLPSTRLAVPFEEFERALMIAPKLVRPLRVNERDGKLLLAQSARDDEDASVPAIAIDDRSLHETERKTAPPTASESAVLSEEAEAARTETAAPSRVPPDKSGVHTHPTVRRMVAIRPEALRSANDDD